MNTYLEIPAYLRRAESDATGDPDALKHHAEGYADTMLSIQAAEMKSIITTHLTDINNRKLIQSDPEGCIRAIDEAVYQLRSAIARLVDTQDFIRSNLTLDDN
jgi:hypothetical protein